DNLCHRIAVQLRVSSGPTRSISTVEGTQRKLSMSPTDRKAQPISTNGNTFHGFADLASYVLRLLSVRRYRHDLKKIGEDDWRTTLAFSISAQEPGNSARCDQKIWARPDIVRGSK